MIKRVILPALAIAFLANISFADTPLWHCTATNTAGAVWNWYGNTQRETKLGIEKACREQNNDQACSMVCFPPKIYYRCYAHDTLPNAITNDPVKAAQFKQGTWYWSSYSEQIAVNGARDACRHNSSFGGCYVNQSECTSS